MGTWGFASLGLIGRKRYWDLSKGRRGIEPGGGVFAVGIMSTDLWVVRSDDMRTGLEVGSGLRMGFFCSMAISVTVLAFPWRSDRGFFRGRVQALPAHYLAF